MGRAGVDVEAFRSFIFHTCSEAGSIPAGPPASGPCEEENPFLDQLLLPFHVVPHDAAGAAFLLLLPKTPESCCWKKARYRL